MDQSMSGRQKVGGTWERDGRWRKMTTEDEEEGAKWNWGRDVAVHELEVEFGRRRKTPDTADNEEEEEEKEKREWKN